MKVDINKIKENKNNPRFIKDIKFKKLVKSIKDFPEMLEKRPIVVDEKMIVLGGNMRLKACKEAGLKKIDVIIAEGWDEEKKKEFIIKDNVGYGEWDWDLLANDWDEQKLKEWALDLPYEFTNLPDEDNLTEEFEDEKLEIKLTFKEIDEFNNAKKEIKSLISTKYKKTDMAVKGGII